MLLFWMAVFLIVIPSGMNYFDARHPYWNDLPILIAPFMLLFSGLTELKKIEGWAKRYAKFAKYAFEENAIPLVKNRIQKTGRYLYCICSLRFIRFFRSSLIKQTWSIIRQDRREMESYFLKSKIHEKFDDSSSQKKSGYSSYAWIPAAMELLDSRKVKS